MLNLPPLIAHLLELFILIFISGVAIGVGLLLLRWIGAASLLSVGERLVFAFALGYGVLAFSMLGMGLLGIVYVPVGVGLLIVLAAICFRPFLGEMRAALPVLRRALGELRYPPNLFLAAVIVVAVGVALAKALVPVATQDDLMYHLALPRRYIEAYAVQFYPDSTYSLFPQLMEMLYTWGLLLGSDRLSVLFALSASLLGPVAAALFAKRHLAINTKGLWRILPLLTAALFLSTPLVGFVLRAANTDFAQASFDLLAVYAFYLGIRDWGSGISGSSNNDPKSNIQHPKSLALLALSGLCCGLSFSVKYYGFAMALALGVALVGVVLFRWRRSEQQAGPLAALLSFGAPIIVLAAPWLLRNLFASGNPVWPLAGPLFDGAYWSREASPEELLGKAPGFSPSNLWTGLEFVWYSITRPPLPIDRHVHVVSLGPLLLPALLALPFARWRPAVRWLAYAAVSYWLLWAFFFSRTSIRYLSTFFLLAVLLGAYGLVSLAVRSRFGQWAVGSVVAATLTLLTVEAALGVGPYLSAALALDRGAEQRYLEAYMEDYPMIQYIQRNLPPNATIYIWDGQPRGYYIPRRYVYARLVPLSTGFGSEPEAWRRRLGEQGITHILTHRRDILAPGQPIGEDPLDEAGKVFADRYFGPDLFKVGDYTLYELRSGR